MSSRMLLAFFLLVRPAAGQLRLPTHDGQGEVLHLPATVEMVFRQQQAVILLLIGLLAGSLAAIVWFSLQLMKTQHTVERVAEAVRRVDLLSLCFRRVALEWDRGVPASGGTEPLGETTGPSPCVLDLGEEPLWGRP